MLRHEPDPSVGAWIRPRLAPFGDVVGSVVPRGFEAYARILHPVPAPLDDRTTVDTERHVRWADVAAVTGRTVHPTAQFWAVAARSQWRDQEPGTWAGGEPLEGDLGPDATHALVDVLARHAPGGGDAQVVVALWDGYGWIEGGGAVSVVSVDDDGVGAVRHPGPAFEPSVLRGPRLELPHREYLLFRGSLRDVTSLGHQVTPSWFEAQSPNLLWPVDGSWCVATEIDLDSTLVGGPRPLVRAVVECPGLEALDVHVDDPITIDSDHLNR
ncbi:hypothetical protein [Cellulomonas carbonis]|uniref:Uncharacterized protein n=1 Tax=Cellulomonas carbonis T26 TaxID=947969 RepID=A0A0A0BKL2_9CELL|nr:hypothetical protein [Cellulomonas carbonis]KGM08531.1 hypothetical protein N868_04580 [Cellulomonas carbonis T26]GGC08519.1 hypothetical protein GCM10010972_22240 [Cellulomonas carbonis]